MSASDTAQDVNSLCDDAMQDMSYSERVAFYAHLTGGLLQMICDRKASQQGAGLAIKRARSFAIRERAAGGVG